MAIDTEFLKAPVTDVPPVDLSWLNIEENGHPWGMRAKPGKRGLTLDEIEIGVVGEVPEQSDNRSMRVRGSFTKRPYNASGPPRRTSPGTRSNRFRTTSSGRCANCARS